MVLAHFKRSSNRSMTALSSHRGEAAATDSQGDDKNKSKINILNENLILHIPLKLA